MKLLTTRQVADMLGLSPATVLRRWREGELPGYRLGSNCLRFSEDEIATWLQSTRGSAYSAVTLQHATERGQPAGIPDKEDPDRPT